MVSPVASRPAAWAMLAVSGLVVFGTAADTFPGSGRSKTIKWAMALSFIIGFFALCLAFFSIKGNKMVELGAAFVLANLWIFIVNTFANPLGGNAIVYLEPSKTEFIFSPNLWYFTWIGFLSAIFVMGLSFGDNKRRVGEAAMVFVVSIVVLSKSAVIKDFECDFGTLTVCGRTKFLISIGVIGMVFSLAGLAMMSSAAINAGAFFVNAVMYFLGVAFGTSASGPASAEGTLYYMLWVGALTSSSIFFGCIAELKGGGEGDEKKGDEKKAEGDNVAENTTEP